MTATWVWESFVATGKIDVPSAPRTDPEDARLEGCAARLASWFERRALLTMGTIRARAGHPYNFTPALAAAWVTYFWVCWNAFSSARAVDISPISAKCVAIASGVHSLCGRLIPSLSMILMTAKEPAPAPMIVRVGASSLSK